ncbi:MAG TPA: triose-phosphate isomerase [Firmicutes bacterium]|nr:triose-phosphate isomerase [Bacillota bacterium]HOQ23380.1 triose-phosphate isomerase [Bacillota bacterium]HPT66798.1 triose-phosphate isomerase [Bacillota bacterium]
MRTPLIAGNWKMYKTIPEAVQLVEELVKTVGDSTEVEVAVCPPFTALATVAGLIKGSKIRLGAQDLFWEKEGAYTGEVSPAMLADLGCHYVIIGHSERREYFGETDETVNKKVQAAFAHGLTPIVCVGESLAQRKAGETDMLVKSQIEKGLAGLQAEDAAKLVIAYEPIWAIGTGLSSDGPDANRVIGLIRRTLAQMYGAAVADRIRIQYGGSVKPNNIKEFMEQPEIDGALVGGASLDAASFTSIVKYRD